MRDFDSNRIYEILGEEFKNIYIVDCKTQQIHAFKETDVLPVFSAHMLYNDAMNQYIDHCVYEKNRDMLRIALSFNSLYTRLENADILIFIINLKRIPKFILCIHTLVVLKIMIKLLKLSLVLRMKIWIFEEIIWT